jgi:hypothetical protein
MLYSPRNGTAAHDVQVCSKCWGLGFPHDNCGSFCASLYADDAAVFIKPTAQDLLITKHILGDALGLVTNMEKTKFFRIRCQDIPIETILGTEIGKKSAKFYRNF